MGYTRGRAGRRRRHRGRRRGRMGRLPGTALGGIAAGCFTLLPADCGDRAVAGFSDRGALVRRRWDHGQLRRRGGTERLRPRRGGTAAGAVQRSDDPVLRSARYSAVWSDAAMACLDAAELARAGLCVGVAWAPAAARLAAAASLGALGTEQALWAVCRMVRTDGCRRRVLCAGFAGPHRTARSVAGGQLGGGCLRCGARRIRYAAHPDVWPDRLSTAAEDRCEVAPGLSGGAFHRATGRPGPNGASGRASTETKDAIALD